MKVKLQYSIATTHGAEKLREEREAENEGMVIPLAIRWLGHLSDIKTRATKRLITASSVTFAV